jgi:peptide/nickel transport system permease protein
MANEVILEEETKSKESYSYWGLVFKRLRKHRMAMIGFFLLLLIIGIVVVGPLVWRVDPLKQSEGIEDVFLPPSPAHPLGTDDYGRDVLARLLYGGRISLFIGFMAAISSVFLGAVVGLISGFFGGKIDTILMRLVDIMLSIPVFPLLIALASILGKGVWQIILVIVVFGWMGDARLVRSVVLTLREEEFSEAERAIGSSPWRIMFVHYLPNVMAPIIVSTTLGIGSAIVYEASISFLGFGVQAPLPSWGNMLQNAQDYIFTHQALVWYPGLAIFLTVLSFNFIGDGLRDAMDPRLYR